MNLRSRISSLVLAATALVLVGCASGSRTVHGKVLPGKVGVVTTVAPDDARLAEPGIGGVRVAVAGGGRTLAESVSASDGSFSLRINEGAIFNRVELEATGEQVLTCRGSLYLPRDDRQVLVLVEPAGSVEVGEQAR